MSYRVRVATVYLLGFFIDLITMFICNVAYPAIARRFDAPVDQLAWISNGYIIGLTLVIPASSVLAQRLGAKRLFLLSLLLFIFATAGAGLANSLPALIVWRVLQGLGGGLLIPVGQTLAYSLYPPHQRARLSAIVMLVGLLAPALSPTLGGIIADSLGWRWVFFASLPLAVVTLILAVVWLRGETLPAIRKTFDYPGLLLSSTGLLALLLGLTRLANNDQRLSGALLLFFGLGLIVCYVRFSLRTPRPLLNLHLLSQPLFRTAMLIYQWVPGVFTGVSLLAMLFLQNQLGMTATQVGELMLPWAMGAFIAISFSGKMFNRMGPRPLFIGGCLINGIGMASLALVSSGDEGALLIAGFAIMGFGSSLCSSTAQSAAFLDFTPTQLADASALWNINRQLSFCLGVTMMSVIFSMFITFTANVPIQAFHDSFLVAAFSAGVPVALCLRLPNRAIVAKIHQQRT